MSQMSYRGGRRNRFYGQKCRAGIARLRGQRGSDRRELSGQLRSDMLIVAAPKQNRLKPHRGGMARSGENHAAPTELERVIEGTVAIHMSLLRSWAWAGLG